MLPVFAPSQDQETDFNSRLTEVEQQRQHLTSIFEQDKLMRNQSYQEEHTRLKASYESVIETLKTDHKTALEERQAATQKSDMDIAQVRSDYNLKLTELRNQHASEIGDLEARHKGEVSDLRGRLGGITEKDHQISDLRHELEKTSAKYEEELREVLKSKESLKDQQESQAVLSLKADVKRTGLEVSELHGEIAEKDRVLSDNERQLGTLREEIQTLKGKVLGVQREAEETIHTLEKEVAGLKYQVEEKDGLIRKRDDEIAKGLEEWQKKQQEKKVAARPESKIPAPPAAKAGPGANGSAPGSRRPSKGNGKAGAAGGPGAANTNRAGLVSLDEKEPVVKLLPLYSDRMQQWRDSTQELEDNFLSLTQPEWLQARATLSGDWDRISTDLKSYVTSLVKTFSSKDRESLALKERLIKVRTSTESKIMKRYQESMKTVGAGKPGSPGTFKWLMDYFVGSVWSSESKGGFCLYNEQSAKENDITIMDGRNEDGASSPDSDGSAPKFGKKLTFGSIMEELRGKSALDLWRDALLIQPAVDDLAEEILESLNQDDAVNGRFRRVLGLSKSMQRGKSAASGGCWDSARVCREVSSRIDP